MNEEVEVGSSVVPVQVIDSSTPYKTREDNEGGPIYTGEPSPLSVRHRITARTTKDGSIILESVDWDGEAIHIQNPLKTELEAYRKTLEAIANTPGAAELNSLNGRSALAQAVLERYPR